MPNSSRFKDLRKRISELREHMLPRHFSPTGESSSRVSDRARGFRILAHAEVEAYLEEVAFQTIQEKIKDFKEKNIPSLIIINFLASYQAGWAQGDEQAICGPSSRTKPKDHCYEAIDIAVRQYKVSVISANNGIKSKNLRNIFVPLGVDFQKIDSTWENDMETFGKKRGEFAHHSTVKVKNEIDPQGEFKDVKRILDGLRKFDSQLVELKKK